MQYVQKNIMYTAKKLFLKVIEYPFTSHYQKSVFNILLAFLPFTSGDNMLYVVLYNVSLLMTALLTESASSFKIFVEGLYFLFTLHCIYCIMHDTLIFVTLANIFTS